MHAFDIFWLMFFIIFKKIKKMWFCIKKITTCFFLFFMQPFLILYTSSENGTSEFFSIVLNDITFRLRAFVIKMQMNAIGKIHINIEYIRMKLIERYHRETVFIHKSATVFRFSKIKLIL